MYLGANIRLTQCNGINGIINQAKKEGSNFIQIFLKSPQSTLGPRYKKNKLLEIKKKLEDNNIKIVIHASYMLNFCNSNNTFIYKNAVRLLVQDLEDSVYIGSIGVVVHMGKNVRKLNFTVHKAIENYVYGIKEVLEKSPKESTIILETGAGQGSEICTSIFQLGLLYKRFNKNERKRIKFCIDTCHIFSSGYFLSSPKYVNILIDHIKVCLGWENVNCIHLNDSKTNVNSRLDRHEDIGYGFINKQGLIKFIRYCIKKNIPIVLETPAKNISYKNQIINVKKLVDSLVINNAI
jgi:deoxyribonuclease IV